MENLNILKGKSILITGGTGSVGKVLVKYLLENFDVEKIIIYSRDEYKQYLMQKEFEKHKDKLKFFIGDIRDKERLYRALYKVDYIIHAAALKHVPIAEYNPVEVINTNIKGAQNLIEVAIDRGVKKVIALSTDKAVNPISLYGATKLVSDKLFISSNSYTIDLETSFIVVRFGNIAGTRGSVIPYFKSLKEKKVDFIPITDSRMTRFWTDINEAIDLILKALSLGRKGEIFVSKSKSFKIIDLAKAIAPEIPIKEIGIREGEKLHEIMITYEDSRYTYEYNDFFVIYPYFDWYNYEIIPNGKKVEEGFIFSSDNNQFFSVEELKDKVEKLENFL